MSRPTVSNDPMVSDETIRQSQALGEPRTKHRTARTEHGAKAQNRGRKAAPGGTPVSLGSAPRLESLPNREAESDTMPTSGLQGQQSTGNHSRGLAARMERYSTECLAIRGSPIARHSAHRTEQTNRNLPAQDPLGCDKGVAANMAPQSGKFSESTTRLTQGGH